MKKTIMTLLIFAFPIVMGSEMSPGGMLYIQRRGSALYVTHLASLHDCGMSMIPPPNYNRRKKKPAVGSIQNPRWSNYKDSDYRKNGRSRMRPKLSLELNYYKNKK